MTHLLIALGTMFVQQTFVAIGRTLPAVIAPAIIADLRYDAAWIGVYFGCVSVASLVVQLGCGGFIVRHGALRMSQVSLVLIAAGSAVAALGTPLTLIAAAIFSGAGSALSTPSSSHLLGRCSPPQHLPLVFSIKQTAVPAGMLLSGALGPPLTQLFGWRATMVGSALACAAFILAMQPLRQRYDDDRVPDHPVRLSDLGETLAVVWQLPRLRALSFACLAFNGLQSVMTAYFVVFLTSIGYAPVAAGFVFSLAVLVAMPGRILWGWLGSGLVPLRIMLGGLALGMAAGSALLGWCDAGSSTLVVGAAACLLSATALSWHGVLLAEAARAAPDGRRGAVTGGVLSFGQVGGLLEPMVFSVLLGATGSYGAGFIACGVPALAVGVLMLRRRPGPADGKPASRRSS
ncbi:MAG: MFS transporter [Burkholderiales bacterium]|nr:MFS transporter [Burkholderiales bacterium]